MIKSGLVSASALLLVATTAWAQALPQFEVASIRPSTPMPLGGGQTKGGRSGAPVDAAGSCGIARLTLSSSRAKFLCVSLAHMIAYAYGVRVADISGSDWMTGPGAAKFDVVAKLPQGSEEAQAPQMFQSLLNQRFMLAVHLGNKLEPGYALVAAGGGVRLKEAALGANAVQPPADPDPLICPPQNFNCAPAIRNIGGVQIRVTPVSGEVRKLSNARIGVGTVTRLGPGKTKIEAPSITLAGLADVLTSQLGAVVADSTGVSGRFEALLEVSVNVDQLRDQAEAAIAAAKSAGPGPLPAAPAGDPVLAAYQNALQRVGLHLESRKATIETLVVDHAEKIPTEN